MEEPQWEEEAFFHQAALNAKESSGVDSQVGAYWEATTCSFIKEAPSSRDCLVIEKVIDSCVEQVYFGSNL